MQGHVTAGGHVLIHRLLVQAAPRKAVVGVGLLGDLGAAGFLIAQGSQRAVGVPAVEGGYAVGEPLLAEPPAGIPDEGGGLAVRRIDRFQATDGVIAVVDLVALGILGPVEQAPGAPVVGERLVAPAVGHRLQSVGGVVGVGGGHRRQGVDDGGDQAQAVAGVGEISGQAVEAAAG